MPYPRSSIELLGKEEEKEEGNGEVEVNDGGTLAFQLASHRKPPANELTGLRLKQRAALTSAMMAGLPTRPKLST
jgi:hypothetical protein